MGIAKVEDIIGQTVRRDIGRMKRFAEGQLEAAARSIMSTPNAHVGIVTGFFIRKAVPPAPETDRRSAAEWPVTHLNAIERVSPASAGKPHREYGADMSDDTAPLHLLFDDPDWRRPWVTIGIGDGGNEIGMGVLPEEIVRDDIPNGRLISAAVSADYLIVSSVSNWGGWGLVSAMAMVAPKAAATPLLAHLTPAPDRADLPS